jgi:transposase
LSFLTVTAPFDTGAQVGLDRGIRVLAALSDGTLIPNLRPGSTCAAVVALHARHLDALSKKDAAGHVLNRRDPARIAAGRRLARAKEHEANARRDWLHKKSRDIVNTYDQVAIEDLRARSMTRSAKGTVEAPGTNVRAKAGLNRALLDAGLGMFATLIREKAAHAARSWSALIQGTHRRRVRSADTLRKKVGKERNSFALAAAIRPTRTSMPRA